MWTYTTNTVAIKAYNTPSMESVVGIKDGDKVYEGKNILISNDALKDVMIVNHGVAMAAGVEVNNVFYPAATVVINGNDTIVSDHKIVLNDEGVAKVKFNEMLSNVSSVAVNGKTLDDSSFVKVKDYLSNIQGKATLTVAAIVSKDKDGQTVLEDAKNYDIPQAGNLAYETKVVLNAASKQYNEAGNWVGLLYAIQALGSVAWAVVLPRFRSRKFSYALSLILGAIGFISMGYVTSPYLLFVSFLLIGCAWAAMLAWPFTILTNSLKGGNIGAYLGLFNCTICIPQIIAALMGGWILHLLSTPGELAPENLMMVVAGVAIAIGALCVGFIKEGKKSDDEMKVQETPEISETL
ncbi:MAG: MFS transporter [Muribaculaceae bacterium]|nr:MFS transporter [Muribaculaceae bacterium]